MNGYFFIGKLTQKVKTNNDVGFELREFMFIVTDPFVDSCFSFTRFISMSASELNNVMLAGLLVR